MADLLPSQPSLGTNMAGIADWSTQHPFVDKFRTARDWIANGTDVWDTGIPIPENASGWPTGVPAGVAKVTTIVGVDPASEYASGRYVVMYEGTGTVEYSLTTTKVASQSQPGRDIVVVNDSSSTIAQQQLFLHITSTSASDPIRNIHIVREDQINLYNAGETFNPAFIEKMQDFRELRFMDWMITDQSTDVSWAGRPTLSSASWATGGVPVEVMVELANRTGTDPWFCMPHQASDDYIRQFATYVRDHLDPRLKAHVEYSNEVWNWQFTQAHYALQQADLRWAVDSNGNGTIDPSEHIGDGWMQFSGMRAAQTHDIWTQVFGAQADARLDRVIATQTGWTGLEEPLLNAPLYVAEGNAAPYTRADSYAITGYFEGGLYAAENVATVLAWAGQGAAGMAKAFQQLEFGNLLDDHGGSLADLKGLYAYHAAAAERYGLQLTMYEAGAHLVSYQFDDATNATLTAFFARLFEDPRMGALYTKNIEAYKAAGGTLFNNFSDFSTPSKYGYWGVLDSVYDDGSPRWDAIVAANGNLPADWETRDSNAFANGKLIIGTNGANVLTGTTGGDRFFAGNGDDRLIGGLGSDILNGSGGNDIADYRSSTVGATINFGTRIGTGAAAGDTFISIEDFYGSNTARDVFAGAGSLAFHFYGFGGNDAMTGAAGADLIAGAAGVDRIVGRGGNDELYGGTQADTFVYDNRGFGHDKILDFEDGLDKLQFTAAAATGMGGITITRNDSSIVEFRLASDPSSIVTLRSLGGPIHLDSSDFIFT